MHQEVTVNRLLMAGCAAVLLIGAGPAPRPTTVPAAEIGKRLIIFGELGLPVGKDTEITGRKRSVGPNRDMFVVETIDGKPAPDGLRIQVNGIKKWPEETKATLQGCEVGTLRFVTEHEGNPARNDKRWKGPYQQLFLSFHVSVVVAPDGLKIESER
jgi:hypothetical protein